MILSAQFATINIKNQNLPLYQLLPLCRHHENQKGVERWVPIGTASDTTWKMLSMLLTLYPTNCREAAVAGAVGGI